MSPRLEVRHPDQIASQMQVWVSAGFSSISTIDLLHGQRTYIDHCDLLFKSKSKRVKYLQKLRPIDRSADYLVDTLFLFLVDHECFPMLDWIF
jgi:hypothetical protein